MADSDAIPYPQANVQTGLEDIRQYGYTTMADLSRGHRRVLDDPVTKALG